MLSMKTHLHFFQGNTLITKPSPPEGTKQIFIRKSPLEIIRTACFHNWCTYEGRRRAVTHHTNFKQKIPIPINTHKGIYFFPTHSPNHIDNHWISFQPILHITNQQTNGQAPKETMITFTNDSKLKLNISKYILENQMRRTFECIYLAGRKILVT